MFVTACSANHYDESLALISNLQHYFTGYQLYYYDLGLTKEQKKSLDVTKYWNVIYRLDQLIDETEMVKMPVSCCKQRKIVAEYALSFFFLFFFHN